MNFSNKFGQIFKIYDALQSAVIRRNFRKVPATFFNRRENLYEKSMRQCEEAGKVMKEITKLYANTPRYFVDPYLRRFGYHQGDWCHNFEVSKSKSYIDQGQLTDDDFASPIISDECQNIVLYVKKDEHESDPCICPPKKKKKKKEDPSKKKKGSSIKKKEKDDPCKKEKDKDDPCKEEREKYDSCRREKEKVDPCKKKKDPCKKIKEKKEDPCKKKKEKKEDPCKKKDEDDYGEKDDPCKKKEDPCKKKEDPCKKKKEDPCKKKKVDPCKKKEDPCKKKKEDPCKKKKEDPCKKKKEDPCKKKKEDPCKKKKEDPCKKKNEDEKKCQQADCDLASSADIFKEIDLVDPRKLAAAEEYFEGNYGNPTLHSFHRYSFHNVQNYLSELRNPQPSSESTKKQKTGVDDV